MLWLEEGAGNSGEEVQRWCRALVRGEQEFAEAGLQELFRNVLSFQPALWTRWTCFLAQERTDAGLRELEYAAACPALAQIRPEHAPEPENKALLSQVQVAHDRSPQTPESVYQSFVLGLLVNLRETHRVRSNREAGFGRYDVIVAPKAPGGPGVVLEFKVIDSAEQAQVNAVLERGIAQIRAKHYAAELTEAGADPQHAIAIVCCGKQVWLRAEALAGKSSPTRSPSLAS